jgi:hypothetical protein
MHADAESSSWIVLLELKLSCLKGIGGNKDRSLMEERVKHPGITEDVDVDSLFHRLAPRVICFLASNTVIDLPAALSETICNLQCGVALASSLM